MYDPQRCLNQQTKNLTDQWSAGRTHPNPKREYLVIGQWRCYDKSHSSDPRLKFRMLALLSIDESTVKNDNKSISTLIQGDKFRKRRDIHSRTLNIPSLFVMAWFGEDSGAASAWLKRTLWYTAKSMLAKLLYATMRSFVHNANSLSILDMPGEIMWKHVSLIRLQPLVTHWDCNEPFIYLLYGAPDNQPYACDNVQRLAICFWMTGVYIS